MHTLNSLLNQYCQLFGYSSCSDLSSGEMFFVGAVGVLAILALVTFLQRIITGISH